MLRLASKTALVTGGSRGIGAGIVKRLAAEGANIIFTYVSSAEKAQELVSEVESYGVKAKAIKADTGNQDEINKVVATAAEWGKIDVLVNSAGLFITGAIGDNSVDLDALRRQWDVNTLGVAHTVRAVVPMMNDGGRIISIGSTVQAAPPIPESGTMQQQRLPWQLTHGVGRETLDKEVLQ